MHPIDPLLFSFLLGRVGAVLGFFRCFDSPCIRQSAPHSVLYGLPNVGTNIGFQIFRLLCFYV
jgi:hypothetical protein